MSTAAVLAGEPRISLCIPAYNAAAFVRTAVESCLAQRVPAYEVLLSDDGSTDGTSEILAAYARHPRVRIVSPTRNLGIGEHYRHLVGQARGDYCVLLSNDDALHPDFIGDASRRLRAEPDLAMLAYGGFTCDASMRPVRRFGLGYPRRPFDPGEGFRHFVDGCAYLISFTVWRCERLAALPPLAADAALVTDWFWAMESGRQDRVAMDRTPRGYYRHHDANASHSDPDRWARQAVAMLRWYASLPDMVPADAARLQERAERIAGARPVSNVSAPPARGLKDGIAKWLARAYPRHPEYLR